VLSAGGGVASPGRVGEIGSVSGVQAAVTINNKSTLNTKEIFRCIVIGIILIKGLIIFNFGLWCTIKRQGSVFSPKLFVNAP
jgi:hypothetical protein